MSAPGATVTGIAVGFALYAVNFHLLAMAFPWVATARSLLGAFVHVAFGAVAAFTYHAMTHEQTREGPIFDMKPRAPTI
jgi:hypothetical protein